MLETTEFLWYPQKFWLNMRNMMKTNYHQWIATQRREWGMNIYKKNFVIQSVDIIAGLMCLCGQNQQVHQHVLQRNLHRGSHAPRRHERWNQRDCLRPRSAEKVLEARNDTDELLTDKERSCAEKNKKVFFLLYLYIWNIIHIINFFIEPYQYPVKKGLMM